MFRFRVLPLFFPLLLLPLFDCGTETAPPPDSVTRLAITELFTFTDSEYNFHVTGKVKNFSARNAEDIVVTALIFSDPDHRLPLQSTAQNLPPVPEGEGFRTFDLFTPGLRILPGTDGFPALFFEIGVEGRVGGGETIPVPELEFASVKSSYDIFGRLHVRARIENRGEVPVDMVYFTVSFFRDAAKTDLVARLRRGFGRFLGVPPETGDGFLYPTYILDLWHPDLNLQNYPTLSFTAELSQ